MLAIECRRFTMGWERAPEAMKECSDGLAPIHLRLSPATMVSLVSILW